MSRVGIITGVRRIGKVVAFRLLELGYDLAVVYRSDESSVFEISEFGKRTGREVLPIRADLSREESYYEVVERTVERF
ncbi:MAG: dehydrogenase, partial [Aquificae bacterium]|nr:dehydrogenase [Aquificota bacterium]